MIYRSTAFTTLALAGVLISIPAGNQATAAHTAIPGRIRLAGIVPAAANNARIVGLAPLRQRLSLQVDLPLRHFASLEAANAGLSDPAAPGFQRFATPGQLTARYGPTPRQLAKVETYLSSAGITITSVSPQRDTVDASATVAEADHAFHVRIKRYRSADGQAFYAPSTDPSLPTSVARLVLAVSGLDDLAQPTAEVVTCTTKPTGGAPAGTCAAPRGVGNAGYTPGQLRTAYGITPLARSKACRGRRCDGAGQRIGILEFGTSWRPRDVSEYDAHYGLASPSTTSVCPRGVRCPVPASFPAVQEADLDVEVAHGMAPKAQVVVYESPKSGIASFGSALGDLFSTILNKKTVTTTNSISYGACESDIGRRVAFALHQKLVLLAMRGEVFFASSGDHGKYCHKGSIAQIGPDYPASDPLVTAVAGTSLFLNSDGSYAYEYAWSESGGGSSTYPWNARPAWQTGPGIPGGDRRLVPDVSADAFCSLDSPCLGEKRADYDITGPGTSYPKAELGYSVRTLCRAARQCWIADGGTSAASPLWAAVTATYNQVATSAGRVPLNANVNAQLYGLAFRPSPRPGAITDVTFEAESGADLYRNAGPGWDGATGVGSPQADVMVIDAPPDPRFAISGFLNGVVATSATSAWAVGFALTSVARSLAVRWDGTRWKQAPTPSPAFASVLNGVAAVSASDVWAVGSAGNKTLILRWRGARWRQVPSPNAGSRNVFYSVAATSARNAWAVGLAGNGLLIAHWNGSTWRKVATKNPPGGGYLTGVTALSADNAWAVGAAGSNANDTLILHWNGATWRRVRGVGLRVGTLTAVTSITARNIWAVGYSGDKGLIVHWNGSVWKRVPGPKIHASGTFLYGISAASARDIWAVGTGPGSSGVDSALIEHWDGRSWARVRAPRAPQAANFFLNAVTASRSTSTWAVGVLGGGDSGTTIVLRWNGHFWSD